MSTLECFFVGLLIVAACTLFVMGAQRATTKPASNPEGFTVTIRAEKIDQVAIPKDEMGEMDELLNDIEHYLDRRPGHDTQASELVCRVIRARILLRWPGNKDIRLVVK